MNRSSIDTSGGRWTLHLVDAEATVALGATLARVARAGLLIFLEGELGAGKTTLSRGLLHALGHTGAVKSPTYTLIELYDGVQPPVGHVDLYRLKDPEELEWLGLRDLLRGDRLCLIEWPARGQGVLPAPDLRVSLGPAAAGGEGREAVISAGPSLVAALQAVLGAPADAPA